MSDDTTSGLGPEQLARLLDLGTDEAAKGADQDEPKADRLAALLESAVPADDVLVQALPEIILRVCRELKPLATGSVKQALLGPDSNLAVITQIKSYAKELARQSEPGAAQEAAKVLYYAAMASALVFHDEKITKLSGEELRISFEQLGAASWVPEDISGLMNRAARIYRDHDSGQREQV